jgi:hypothetical protein
MKPTFAHLGRRLRSALVAKVLALGAVLVGAAAAGTFASELFSSPDFPAAVADPAPPCDPDGVAVGYDVAFDATLAAHAVVAVRVIDIAPDCAGAQVAVRLVRANGAPLDDSFASATASGAAVRLELEGPVLAADVARIDVAIAGYRVPAPELPPAPIAPSPPLVSATALLVPPSLCPTVRGEVSVVAEPQECSAVVADRLDRALVTPVPVASWPAGAFGDRVQVTLRIPEPDELPVLRIGAAGTFVRIEVRNMATGEQIRRWSGVLAIDFPAVPSPFRSVYSDDGAEWREIPRLPAPELPEGQDDGYWVRENGTVVVYTRHATFFALAPRPRQVERTYAKLLPTGAVRFTWTPSVAGLGVASYEVLGNGRVLARVPGTTTRAVFARLGPRPVRLSVRAVDPLGETSPPAAARTVRVPLLVGARVLGVASGRVRAEVRLTERARLRVLVLDARGRRLPLQPRSTLAGRVVQRATTGIDLPVRPRGLHPLDVRLPRQRLRPGARYRVVVIARGDAGRADRAELRFRGAPTPAGR